MRGPAGRGQPGPETRGGPVKVQQAFRQSIFQLPGSISGPYIGSPASAASRQAGPHPSVNNPDAIPDASPGASPETSPDASPDAIPKASPEAPGRASPASEGRNCSSGLAR